MGRGGMQSVVRSGSSVERCLGLLSPRLLRHGLLGERAMQRFVFLLVPLIAVAPLGAGAAPQNLPRYIAAALADPNRPTNNKEGDSFRKPGETLAFSGVKPGMIVGEFYPGGGYFTRLLSDVVGSSGHVYGIENDKWEGAVEADQALLKEGKWGNVSIDVQPFGTVNFPKPIDIAWVTQNYHD